MFSSALPTNDTQSMLFAVIGRRSSRLCQIFVSLTNDGKSTTIVMTYTSSLLRCKVSEDPPSFHLED